MSLDKAEAVKARFRNALHFLGLEPYRKEDRNDPSCPNEAHVLDHLEEYPSMLEDSVKIKDAEILSLKEQVASLQRVLAHHRDSDSVVDGPGEEDGPWAAGWNERSTVSGFEDVLIHKGSV